MVKVKICGLRRPEDIEAANVASTKTDKPNSSAKEMYSANWSGLKIAQINSIASPPIARAW